MPPVNFIIDMILGEEVHLQQPEIAIKIVGKEERERDYIVITQKRMKTLQTATDTLQTSAETIPQREES